MRFNTRAILVLVVSAAVALDASQARRPSGTGGQITALKDAVQQHDATTALTLARELVTAPDPEARWTALRVLSIGGGPEDIERVRPLERDTHPRIAAHAAFVRAKLQKLADAERSRGASAEPPPRAPDDADAPRLVVESGFDLELMKLSPDGKVIAARQQDRGRVVLLEAGSGRTICDASPFIERAFAQRGWRFGFPETYLAMFAVFGPDSRWAVVEMGRIGDEETRFAVVDVYRCRVSSAFALPGRPDVLLGPGGDRMFVSRTSGQHARIVSTETGEIIADVGEDTFQRNNAAWAINTRDLVYGDYDKFLIIDGRTGTRRTVALPEPARGGSVLAVSDDGTRAVVASNKPFLLRVFALDDGRELWRFSPSGPTRRFGVTRLSTTVLSFAIEDRDSDRHEFWEAHLPDQPVMVGSSASAPVKGAGDAEWVASGKGVAQRVTGTVDDWFLHDARTRTTIKLSVAPRRELDFWQPTIVMDPDSQAVAFVQEEKQDTGAPDVVWVGQGRQFSVRPVVTPVSENTAGSRRWGMSADSTVRRLVGAGDGFELWTWGPTTNYRERRESKPSGGDVQMAMSHLWGPGNRLHVAGAAIGPRPKNPWHAGHCDGPSVSVDDGEMVLTMSGIEDCTLGPVFVAPPAPQEGQTTWMVDPLAQRVLGLFENGGGTIDMLSLKGTASRRDLTTVTQETHIAGGGVDGLWARWEQVFGNQTIEIRRAPSDERVCSVVAVSQLMPSQVEFVMQGRILAASSDGHVQFWNARTCEALPTLSFPEPGVWVVADRDGRFDTNNIDAAGRAMQWVRPDAPTQGWPIELFARTYFEPGLLARRLAGEVLPPAPRLGDLNPAQPELKFAEVVPIAGQPGRVRVGVRVSAGRAVVNRNGVEEPRTTGVHDVRLLRNGVVVEGKPERGGRIDLGSTGTKELTFDIAVAPEIGADGQPSKTMRLSAYAFNDDGVRSRAIEKIVPATGVGTRKRRAVIVSIGVNATGVAGTDLVYAASDARQMQQVLLAVVRQSGKYDEVAGITLTSERQPDGRMVSTATKTHIKAVIDRLVGREADASRLGELKDAAALVRSGPEDLVLITWAGHGVTDARGRYYLLPSDLSGSKIDDSVLAGAISSDELAEWLLPLDAAASALVIDACHGGAAVGPGFKPAPLGPRGLGQLAYDKGLRVLVASQANELATESGTLKRGLLVHALLVEGIQRGGADLSPKNGAISLVEWLTHARDRVPDLMEQVLGAGAGQPNPGAGWSVVEGPRALQRPVLFDFRATAADPEIIRLPRR